MIINRKKLAQALRFVSTAVSKALPKTAINCILFEHEYDAEKDTHYMALVGTNNHSLNETKIPIDAMDGIESFEPFVAEPFKVANEKDLAPVELLIDDFGDAIYKDGKTTTYLSIFEGEFPHYQETLNRVCGDQNAGIGITINGKLLTDTIKNMADDGSKVKRTRVEFKALSHDKPILITNLIPNVYEKSVVMPITIK
jgi:DNA polymerase III sliding clamp (beta) subunit (PCNA family)